MINVHGRLQLKTKKRELCFMAIFVVLLAAACGGLIWISYIERGIVSIVMFSIFECAILIIGVSCIIRASLLERFVVSEKAIPWSSEMLGKLFEGREVNVVEHHQACVDLISIDKVACSGDPFSEPNYREIWILLKQYGHNISVFSVKHIAPAIDGIVYGIRTQTVDNHPGTIFYKDGSATITIEETCIPKWTIGEMFRFYVHKTIPSGRLRWDIMAEIALGFMEDE